MVAGSWKIGNEVSALIICHDNSGEARIEIVCFGDNPNTGLGAGNAGHDTGDVVIVNRNALLGRRQRILTTGG